MKRKSARVSGPIPVEVAANLTRGMVAAGLLAALQDGGTDGQKPSARKVLRHALQGGAALAAGAAAADALRGQRYAAAVLSVAAGAAGVLAVEYLLNPARSPMDGSAHEETSLG